MEALTGAPATGRVRRLSAAAGALLVMAACLLATACSGGSSSSSSAGSGAVMHGAAPAPAAGGRGAAEGAGSRLTTLAPGGHALVYTAQLTVRARSTGQAVRRAAQIAASENGYVSSEAATTAHGGDGSVSITLKVPASAYGATLTALSQLGTQLSAAQHTQDVTQTVADTSSRVASAKAAISQLRKLLGRAGSVGGLLDVQDQINQQESALESLESQQRALDHSVAYATISLLLVSTPAAARHRARHAGGFTGGLLAGWHGLRIVVTGLATAAGAVLPFALPLAAIAVGGWLAWRRYGRRRVTAGREPTPGAPGP